MAANLTTTIDPPSPQQVQAACCVSWPPGTGCCVATQPPQYIIETPKYSSWTEPILPYWAYIIIAIGVLLFVLIIIFIIAVLCCRRCRCFWCCCFEDRDADSATGEIVDKEDSAYRRRGAKRQQILYRYPEDDASDMGRGRSEPVYLSRAQRLSSGRAHAVHVVDDIDDTPRIAVIEGGGGGRRSIIGGGTMSSSRVGKSSARGVEYIEADDVDDLVYARPSGGGGGSRASWGGKAPMAVVTVGGPGSTAGAPSSIGGYHSAAVQVSGSGNVNHGMSWTAEPVQSIYPALH